MKAIDAEGFEQKFRDNIDPWNYRASRFEAFKRRALLHACGTRPYARVLELACAIGETSSALAPRCLRLLAVDSSATAIAHARRTHGHLSRVRFAQAELPGQMPPGPFDLIVASEIAYYLPPAALRDLMRRISAATAPSGRVVILHHLFPFGDAAQLPALAQSRAKAWLGGAFRLAFQSRNKAYEVAALEKRR